MKEEDLSTSLSLVRFSKYISITFLMNPSTQRQSELILPPMDGLTLEEGTPEEASIEVLLASLFSLSLKHNQPA